MQIFWTVLSLAGIAGCILWLILFLRKKPKKSTVACVLLALALFTVNSALQLKKIPEAGGPQSGAPNSAAGGTVSFQADYVSGYYTPGIDFPAGRYTVTVLAGSGSIYHTEPTTGGKTYRLSAGDKAPSLSLELPLGEALSVSGLKIRIKSDSADSEPLSWRDNPATEEITLAPGTYLTGKEFSEGIYDIIALHGKGHVTSDSTAANIDSALDASGADYQKEFKNLILDDTTKLTVTGVTIKLSPSK